MITVLVIGNPRDIKCWSGTPYFITKALEAKGQHVYAPDTGYSRFNIIRLLWGLGRILRGKRPNGFQYSRVYEYFFIQPHLNSLDSDDIVLSLNTHIPSKALIKRYNLFVVHYDDSTVKQIVDDPNYYWASINSTDKWIFKKEQDALDASKWTIGMTSYAEEGLRKYLGDHTKKVQYILGGINIPDEIEFRIKHEPTESFTKEENEIHFGLIAVDPEFKGYGVLKLVMETLEHKGFRCFAHIIGGVPRDTTRNTYCYGFINKKNEPDRFIEIVSRMDYGWLYPKFEAFGITVLEFYSYEIPMIALNDFGPASTASDLLGIAIKPNESVEQVANRILEHWSSDMYYQSKARIRSIKHLLTWERAVEEMLTLIHGSFEEFTPFRLPQ